MMFLRRNLKSKLLSQSDRIIASCAKLDRTQRKSTQICYYFGRLINIYRIPFAHIRHSWAWCILAWSFHCVVYAPWHFGTSYILYLCMFHVSTDLCESRFFCVCVGIHLLCRFARTKSINEKETKIHNASNRCRRWVRFSLAVSAIETSGKSNKVTVTIDFTVLFLKTQFSFHLLELPIWRNVQNST